VGPRISKVSTTVQGGGGERALAAFDWQHQITHWHGAANSHCDAGRYSQSRTAFAQAFEVATRHLSVDDPAFMTLLNNRAVLGKYSGDFDLAQADYERALAIAQAHFGAEHCQIANLLHNLGGLAHARGDFERGEALARTGLEMRRCLVGAEHPDALADAVAWAGLLDGLGRHGESEPIYRHALGVYEERGELAEIAVCLNNLGSLCAAGGRLAEAEDCYRRALVHKEALLGTEHPDVALSLNNLGLLRKRQGAVADALDLYTRALRIFERTLPATHPRRVAVVGNLARLKARATPVTASTRPD